MCTSLCQLDGCCYGNKVFNTVYSIFAKEHKGGGGGVS